MVCWKISYEKNLSHKLKNFLWKLIWTWKYQLITECKLPGEGISQINFSSDDGLNLENMMINHYTSTSHDGIQYTFLHVQNFIFLTPFCTLFSKEQEHSRDFSKGESHCFKQRIHTWLLCWPPCHVLPPKKAYKGGSWASRALPPLAKLLKNYYRKCLPLLLPGELIECIHWSTRPCRGHILLWTKETLGRGQGNIMDTEKP